jgi:hypothetical protein
VTLPKTKTDPPRLVISGDPKRGALYGCYAFLEDVLGCRWFTAKNRHIPKRPTLEVKNLDIQQSPAFEYREPFFTEAYDRDWAVRNRANGNAARLDESVGGQVKYGRFVHTFAELVPPDRHFESHPEYFSLIDGKRMKGYHQLCLTNPDVLRICIEGVRGWIRERPDATIFSVSQNDTYFPCQCENCKAVVKEEGAESGPMLRFVNQVAEAIGKDHPNVLIDTLAYQYTEPPPAKVKPLPNVRVRLAPIGNCFGHPMDECPQNARPLANLKAWAAITNQLYIWHYSTNFAHYLQPLPTLREIETSIPLYKRFGAVGLFYQGSYEEGGGGALAELKAYLIAKLMWNPSRPPRPVIEEFAKGVYGKAAAPILAWIDLLQTQATRPEAHVHIGDPPTASYFPDSVLQESRRLFDAAESLAKGDAAVEDEVGKARMWMEYVEFMRAKEPAEKTRLGKTLRAKIEKYGIKRAREGEPIERFFARSGIGAGA